MQNKHLLFNIISEHYHIQSIVSITLPDTLNTENAIILCFFRTADMWTWWVSR